MWKFCDFFKETIIVIGMLPSNNLSTYVILLGMNAAFENTIYFLCRKE